MSYYNIADPAYTASGALPPSSTSRLPPRPRAPALPSSISASHPSSTTLGVPHSFPPTSMPSSAPGRPHSFPPLTTNVPAQPATPAAQLAPNPPLIQVPGMAELEASLTRQTTGIRAPPLEPRTSAYGQVALPSVLRPANGGVGVGGARPTAACNATSVHRLARPDDAPGHAAPAAQHHTIQPTAHQSQTGSFPAQASIPRPAVVDYADVPPPERSSFDPQLVNAGPLRAPAGSSVAPPFLSAPTPRRLAGASTSVDRAPAPAPTLAGQHGAPLGEARKYHLRYPAAAAQSGTPAPSAPPAQQPAPTGRPLCLVYQDELEELIAYARRAGWRRTVPPSAPASASVLASRAAGTEAAPPRPRRPATSVAIPPSSTPSSSTDAAALPARAPTPTATPAITPAAAIVAQPAAPSHAELCAMYPPWHGYWDRPRVPAGSGATAALPPHPSNQTQQAPLHTPAVGATARPPTQGSTAASARTPAIQTALPSAVPHGATSVHLHHPALLTATHQAAGAVLQPSRPVALAAPAPATRSSTTSENALQPKPTAPLQSPAPGGLPAWDYSRSFVTKFDDQPAPQVGLAVPVSPVCPVQNENARTSKRVRTSTAGDSRPALAPLDAPPQASPAQAAMRNPQPLARPPRQTTMGTRNRIPRTGDRFEPASTGRELIVGITKDIADLLRLSPHQERQLRQENIQYYMHSLTNLQSQLHLCQADDMRHTEFRVVLNALSLRSGLPFNHVLDLMGKAKEVLVAWDAQSKALGL